jgi:murein DD-endopeptidase MepM/ murein hydrolase activator NlpD
MARRVHTPLRRRLFAALGGVGALLGVGAFVVFGVGFGRGALVDPSPSAPPASLVARASASPSVTMSASGVPSPAVRPGVPSLDPTTGPTASPGATPTAAPTRTPSSTPPPGAAPRSAAEFDLEHQVIDIGFPLRADDRYHYRDNWLERRAGNPDPYNHALPGKRGTLLRMHDGIDIYAAENEPVLAPFSGTIIDPQTKWMPWHPDRYGLTVVIESDEPTSAGYTAVLVHLDDVWVDLGQHVERGQVIGDVGQTGDADGIKPQLHIELRAPFLIDWSAIGEDRLVDAFNPYASLTAADPNL